MNDDIDPWKIILALVLGMILSPIIFNSSQQSDVGEYIE